MLNCRRFKHVGLTQRIAQLPMPGRGFTFSSYVTQNNLLRQPLLLLRRPQRYLYNIRPPAEAATRQILGAGTARVGSKWTTRLLTFRRYLKINHGDTGGPDRSSFSLMQVLRSDYKRLFRLVQNEKTTLTVGLFCLFISSAITMSVPFFMGKVIDIVFNKDGMNDAAIKKLGEFSLMLFWIFVLGGCANCARVYLFGSSALRIVRRLRADLFRNMLLQEVAWFDSRGTGELINRLSNDTFFVGISLSQNVSDGLRSLAMVAVGSVMMMVTSLKLALVSAVVVPVLAGIAIVYGRYVRKITRAELDKYAMVMKHGEERLGNVRTVKVFTREQTESDDFNEKLNEALEIGYREIKARSIFFGLTGFSGNFSIISVLYYGGNLVLNDHLTIGAMTSFMLYAGYVAVAMNGLSNFYSHLNKGLGASERIWEILERQYDMPIGKGIRPAKRPEGEIMFQNVNFRYPTRPDSHVLKDFSLTLPPHSTTAVVGRSGAGKSTMAMLVMRLYDPKQGAVMLDGVDIRKLDPQWLRQNIGSVSQEPILFSGSIRSNILYGMHPGDLPSEDLLQQVVNDSHVVEFANRLPNGLETIVGQRGILLSGGQKQRVAIARALIKNPTILLLDEATSALDSVSEELVQKALDKLIQGRTVMTIAHRLSTIHKAHKIAVLDGGRVVEEGAFDELMRRPHGVFKELVAKQAFGGSYKSKTTAPDDHNDHNDLNDLP